MGSPKQHSALFGTGFRIESICVLKLPVLDTYRNFLAKPSIEGLLVLKAIRTFEFAA